MEVDFIKLGRLPVGSDRAHAPPMAPSKLLPLLFSVDELFSRVVVGSYAVPKIAMEWTYPE